MQTFKRMFSTIFTINFYFSIYFIKTIIYDLVQCTVISIFFSKMPSNKWRYNFHASLYTYLVCIQTTPYVSVHRMIRPCNGGDTENTH